MPTEHEYKYVIKLDAEARFPKELDGRTIFSTIKQGYLPCPDVVRIRHIEANHEEQWVFTYKKRIQEPNPMYAALGFGGRIVEIETEIDRRDGEDLMSQCDDVLTKRRFKFENWDVDFYFDEDGVYFASAEVELPEGSQRPSELPWFLKNEVIYEVALTDDRFSNKNLTNKCYAKQLFELISNGE